MPPKKTPKRKPTESRKEMEKHIEDDAMTPIAELVKDEEFDMDLDDYIEDPTVDSKEITQRIRLSLGGRTRTWEIKDLIAETVGVSPHIAQNVTVLLDQDCTVPFIARYRKEQTGGIPPEKLREIQEAYISSKNVIKKSESAMKTIAKADKLTYFIAGALLNAKSTEEVDLICAPFKGSGKRTLAERARNLGLEESAIKILDGDNICKFLQDLIKPDIKGLSTKEDVLTGWQHIIADIIAKDRDVLDSIKKLCLPHEITLTCAKSTAATKIDKKAAGVGTSSNFKYENYYSFNNSVNKISSHQVLAINRGENQKALTVKVTVQPYAKDKICGMIYDKFLYGAHSFNRDNETHTLIDKSIKDSYQRLIEPYICRQTRSDLTKKAEKDSILVFCKNLKNLLLTQPFRGKVVLGIDPGFTHGCKLAVVSHTGAILDVSVIYPFSYDVQDDTEKLKNLVLKYRCDTFAIGSGTACREVESYLADLVSKDYFKPLKVQYCIVNEDGVSIYSVTKEAETEMPDLDPNVRSAVSIARRLQDPLLEYVKVEPKHLGVGMYQHDIPEKMLKSSLNDIVIECVSFVGVDLNVCPELVLSKIAGLSVAKAKNIIKWREENGPFQSRHQLNCVRGLGPKTFEQCSGFVKIFPETCKKDTDSNVEIVQEQTTSKKRKLVEKKTSKGKRRKVDVTENNPLDQTIIHPESYTIAQRFMEMLNLDPNDIGKVPFIESIKNYMHCHSVEKVTEEFNVPIATMKLIIEALEQVLKYDIRSECEKPMFRSSKTSLEQLKCGDILTGRVTNTVDFGSFVDIGVGQHGLLHKSKTKRQTLNLGNRVKVKVISLEKERKRIGLELVEVLKCQ